jgi:hypothetical protein
MTQAGLVSRAAELTQGIVSIAQGVSSVKFASSPLTQSYVLFSEYRAPTDAACRSWAGTLCTNIYNEKITTKLTAWQSGVPLSTLSDFTSYLNSNLKQIALYFAGSIKEFKAEISVIRRICPIH